MCSNFNAPSIKGRALLKYFWNDDDIDDDSDDDDDDSVTKISLSPLYNEAMWRLY